MTALYLLSFFDFQFCAVYNVIFFSFSACLIFDGNLTVPVHDYRYTFSVQDGLHVKKLHITVISGL